MAMNVSVEPIDLTETSRFDCTPAVVENILAKHGPSCVLPVSL